MKQFQTNVMWDLTLTDIVCVNSQSPSGVFQGLVTTATKISGTVPDAVVGKYVPLATIKNIATGVWYRNTGTTAAPVWTVIPVTSGGGNATSFQGVPVSATPGTPGQQYAQIGGVWTAVSLPIPVEATTTGTIPKKFFGGNAPFPGKVQYLYLIDNDSTASTITISNVTQAHVIATIAKTGTPGQMLGAIAISNAGFVFGDNLSAVSSNGGNAQVIMVVNPS